MYIRKYCCRFSPGYVQLSRPLDMAADWRLPILEFSMKCLGGLPFSSNAWSESQSDRSEECCPTLLIHELQPTRISIHRVYWSLICHCFSKTALWNIRKKLTYHNNSERLCFSCSQWTDPSEQKLMRKHKSNDTLDEVYVISSGHFISKKNTSSKYPWDISRKPILSLNQPQ